MKKVIISILFSLPIFLLGQSTMNIMQMNETLNTNDKCFYITLKGYCASASPCAVTVNNGYFIKNFSFPGKRMTYLNATVCFPRLNSTYVDDINCFINDNVNIVSDGCTVTIEGDAGSNSGHTGTGNQQTNHDNRRP